MTDLGIDHYRIPPSDVRAAQDVLTGRRELTRCGRPTKAGAPCARDRARFLPACTTHATPAEYAAAATERVRLTALVDDWSNSLVPACHAWPVTDDDRRRVAELPRLPDDELREARCATNLLASWHPDLCAVCGGRGGGDLVLDHDHITALVRGYLCRSCNTSEPHTDRGDFAKYRARPPAVMLGVSARYEHPWYGRLVAPEPWLDRSYLDPNPDQHSAYAVAARLARHLSHDRHPSYALMADLDTARKDTP